jgi:spore coat protein U-like protein
VIDAGSDPGVSAKGVSLKAVAQYKAVANGEARPVVGQIDIGAYEATTAPTTSTTTSWTACATEGGTCSFSGTREVRFGANGAYTSKTVTGSTPCTTTVFGDPIQGVVKSCSYANTATTTTTTTTATFTACAKEGGTCSFSGTREVRYGTSTIYTSKVVTGPVACTNAVFGDPVVGQVKSCSYSSVTK